MRWAVWVQEVFRERPRLALSCFATLLLLLLLSSIWHSTSSMRSTQGMQMSTTLEITVDPETTTLAIGLEPIQLIRSDLQQLRKEVRELKDLLWLGLLKLLSLFKRS